MYLIRLTNALCRRKIAVSNSSRTRLSSSVAADKPPAAVVTETNIKLPLHQRFVSFWKLLFRDYKEAIVDASLHMKERPYKSSIWLTVFGIAVVCNTLNPDEIHYRESFVQKSNELIFVGKSIRNPNAETYMNTLESYFNAGQVKRISFGIFSLILLDYKCSNSALYRDNCSYVQPTYAEIFRDYVLDVGFLDKWWNLEKMMVDYDVNPNEWNIQ